MRLGRMAPDAGETLLLRAALLDPERAAAAWLQWRSTHDVQEIHGRASALLALLPASVPSEELGPDRGLLRGLRRRAWAVNATQRESLSRLLSRLSGAGVEACPVRGSHSLLAVPPHEATLPVARTDLWVAPSDWAAALEVVAALGYAPAAPADPDDSLIMLADTSGSRLALTWGFTFPRWSRTPYELGSTPEAVWRDLSFPTLSASHAVVAAIVEGVAPAGPQALTWPVEVARLVRAHSDDHDFWPLVTEAAVDSGQAPVVSAALAWARHTLDLAVPTTVETALSEGRMEPWLRLERALMSRGLPSASRPRRALDVRRARRIAPWSAVAGATPIP